MRIRSHFHIPPDIEELCGASIYTKLCLRSVYNLVRIRAGKEHSVQIPVTISILLCHMAWQKAPSCLQAFMNDVFCDWLLRFVIVYLDDRHVLRHLPAHEVYIKAKKCEFHVQEVAFFGYHGDG